MTAQIKPLSQTRRSNNSPQNTACKTKETQTKPHWQDKTKKIQHDHIFFTLGERNLQKNDISYILYSQNVLFFSHPRQVCENPLPEFNWQIGSYLNHSSGICCVRMFASHQKSSNYWVSVIEFSWFLNSWIKTTVWWKITSRKSHIS